MIVDEGECKKAAEVLGRTYSGNSHSNIYPSGCYASLSSFMGFFNKLESGTGNANAKSICKQGVYQFIHNRSSSNIYIYFELAKYYNA